MIALIDADILCYEIGFVSEQVSYSIDGKHYETVTEAKKDGVQKEELTRHVYPIKWPFAKKMVDDRIKGILEAVGADDYKCYLTGKGNFRNDVATILKYKGTRYAPKPYHYQNIWDHLVGKYNAEVITGMEADDAISIAQYQGDGQTVICSRDKDLRMVPGFHYSWQCGDRQPEKPLYEISEFQGHYNWAYQMLVGDTVDNIWGVPGIGPVKAAKFLEGCDSAESLTDAVIKVYCAVFGEDKINYQSWDGVWLESNWFGIAEENCKLLWMLRDVKEIPV
jgi:hypothetical protein